MCKCGTRLQKKHSGYSNLISHIRSQHAEQLWIWTSQDESTKPSSFIIFPYSNKAKQLHFWIEMVVHGLQHFSFVLSAVTRRHFRNDGISVDTLMENLTELTTDVEMEGRSSDSRQIYVGLECVVGGGHTLHGNICNFSDSQQG